MKSGAAAIALALLGCAPQVDLVALAQKPDASDPPKDAGVDTATFDSAPPPPPRCAPWAISTITLIDASWTLYAFDPATNQMQVLGQPPCLQKLPPPLAVSVTVEPTGNVWVTVPESQIVLVDRATNTCGKPPQWIPGPADAIAFGRVVGLPDTRPDDFFVVTTGALIEITADQVPLYKWPVPSELAPAVPPSVTATGDGRIFFAGAMPDGMLAIGGVFAPDKVEPPAELKGLSAKESPPTAVVPWKTDFLLFGVSGVRTFQRSTGIVGPAVPLKTVAMIVGAGVSTCAWP